MAVTPGDDKAEFWKRIRYDPYMEKSFGLVGKTDADASVKIRKTRTVDDTELKGDVRFCLIFDTPSAEEAGPYELSCIQVDMLTPSAMQDWADGRLSQIIALCGNGWEVNGRQIHKVVRAGELASSPGFYRCGARFYYYSSTITQVKTL